MHSWSRRTLNQQSDSYPYTDSRSQRARYRDVARSSSLGRVSGQACSYAKWKKWPGHRWPAADSRHLGRLPDGSECIESNIGLGELKNIG